MTRKPLFWIIFVLLSAAGVFFTLYFFPKAFPLVNLNITINRQQALAEANRLAQQQDWGPADFQQAASFSVDTQVQHFVELEAGGVERFNELLAGDLYSPYSWRVRHFKENEKTETTIRFTPDGRFYGFSEQRPENEPGASLASDSALVIAETSAADWQVDLGPFQLVERSQEKQIGGRTDHSFTYERTDAQLGEGDFRLELTVAGDKLAALRHYVKVPEAFQRRYQEMRSANNTIASVALFAIAVLYGILGIGVGLFFLLRERWLKWRTALFWGCFVALLQVLAQINRWPLLWMSYDTALSHSSFFMRQIFQLITLFAAEAVLLTLTFMAAEGLTRKAFPQQIQLWKIWRPAAAGSKPVLGFTLSGYLGVSLFFAFDIALYFFATKVLGWWTPSSSLFEPNVLATYQPWLSSIANSLHAGFWEESLFRAVPIAGAALIGRRFGREKLWIAGAFLVQALIFGAGHANYVQQPAYARVVELILPSIGFGLIYLYLGLLPAIILHFAYDVVWFALPLFVSSTPNIWLQQLLVILFSFVPLWIVLWARLRRKNWADDVPSELKNKAFVPPPPKSAPEEETAEPKVAAKASRGINTWFAVAGFLGIILWLSFTTFQNMVPPLDVKRSGAETSAAQELDQRDIKLSPAWQQLSRVEAPLNVNDRFIWQEEGDSVYASLMGSYLSGPYWLVRYATFEGDVAARAEEYSLKVMSQDDLSFSHTLPEQAPGDSLNEQAARFIAEQALTDKYNVDLSQLKTVSVMPSKLDNRTDWEFVWADTAAHPLKSGECRLFVQLAGSEVVNTYQTVYVPEEWSRTEREKNNFINILDVAVGAIPVLLLVTAFVFAIISWSRKKFDVSLFLKIGVFLTLILLFGVFNSWPMMKSMFVTAAPLLHQMLVAIIFAGLAAVVVGGSIGTVNGFIKASRGRLIEKDTPVNPIAGIGAGLFIAGVMTFVQSFAPQLEPIWASYSDLGARWPILELALGSITALFLSGTVYLLIFAVANGFSRAWTRKKALTAVFVILLGLVFTDVKGAGNIIFWLGSGLLRGVLLWLVYIFVLRYRLSLAPLVFLPVLLLRYVKGFVHDAYPGAQIGYVAGFVVLVLAAILWERWLRSGEKTSSAES